MVPYLQERDKGREWKTNSLDGDDREELAEAGEEGRIPAREGGVSFAPPVMERKEKRKNTAGIPELILKLILNYVKSRF